MVPFFPANYSAIIPLLGPFLYQPEWVILATGSRGATLSARPNVRRPVSNTGFALRWPCRAACYQAPKRRSEIFDMASQSRDDLKRPLGYADLGRKDKVPISRSVLALHPKKTQGTMKCGCNRPRQKGCCDWPNWPAYRAKRRS